MAGNNMVRAISENGGVVVVALDSTNIVREMEQLHKPSGVVSAALGRILTGASLMGSGLKSRDDSLTLRINGGGPVGTLVAISDGDANVRGYVSNPMADAPLRDDGKLNVGAVVGKAGTLSVTRDLGFGEPYVGQIPLVSGEIAEDITSYYATSEQTPTVCSLGVLVNKNLTIKRAGGFLLQLLPGATDAEIDMVERNIARIPPVTELLEKGGTVHDIVDMALEGFNPNLLDERQVDYKCNCNRQRVEDILVGLGRRELEALIEENPQASVECHYCNKKYPISLSELLQKMV